MTTTLKRLYVPCTSLAHKMSFNSMICQLLARITSQAILGLVRLAGLSKDMLNRMYMQF